MPRNRMIKSEFWTSEQIMTCSPLARLLFIGLWNFSDDNGIHPASYKKLKAEVFPSDNCTIENIKNWILELIQQGLLCEYIVDVQAYWIVTGWKKHQRIDKPTYRHPYPQSELKIIFPNCEQSLIVSGTHVDDSKSTHQENSDYSESHSRQIGEYSSNGSDERENKEKRKGKEKHLCEVDTSPVDVCESSHDASTKLFEYWQRTLNHPRAKLDRKRKRAIEQAIKLGYTIPELQKAIDGCKNTPHNMGKNDSGQVYDDISLIFRDSEHIERFIRNADNSLKEDHDPINSLMAGVL